MIVFFQTHFQGIVWGWIALAVATFILLQFVTAPFGRHTSTGWGPMIKNKYGWLLMELPSFTIILISLLMGTQVNQVTWVIGGLWLVHYFNRAFIFPFRITSGDKEMPLFITFSAIFFNLCNAGLNGYYLAELSSYTPQWLTGWQFIAGATLFVFGSIVNIWSDEILMHLHRPSGTGYVIPYGGFFKFVSAPNLFGETVAWTGFALLAWNLPAASFAIWTFANLVPRAMAHHRFYLEKFPAYPKERRAIFPFVY